MPRFMKRSSVCSSCQSLPPFSSPSFAVDLIAGRSDRAPVVSGATSFVDSGLLVLCAENDEKPPRERDPPEKVGDSSDGKEVPVPDKEDDADDDSDSGEGVEGAGSIMGMLVGMGVAMSPTLSAHAGVTSNAEGGTMNVCDDDDDDDDDDDEAEDAW